MTGDCHYIENLRNVVGKLILATAKYTEDKNIREKKKVLFISIKVPAGPLFWIIFV